MEKTKLLTITIIGLFLLNLGTLGFLFLNGPKGHRPPHEGGADPKEVIIDKLHFDATQQKKYTKLIEWHREEIEKQDRNIREAKQQLYAQLNQVETSAKTKDSLIALINLNQKQIEETHFKHFEDIKKLCHKDQLENFNDLTEELGRIFASKPHGPIHD